MSDNSPVYASGISTTGLLGVLFVGLKLTGYISWPWLWVLSPFWLPLAIVLAVILIALAVGGAVVIIEFLLKLYSK